jgi:lysophospholipase L1-like esterase
MTSVTDRWPLLLRLALHALLGALVLTWIARPAAPSDLYRVLVPALFGLAALPLLVPAWRARWSGALRRRLRVLDFLAFNGVCLLLLVEGGLRLAGTLSDSPLLAPPNANAAERIATWRGRPGETRFGFTLNSRGLHDLEFREDRTPGVRRVVALADSFGFGLVPYHENFLTQLDELLDAHGETEVVNYGIPSIDPEDYLHLYRTEVHPLQPDVVLTCLYVGNDISRLRRSSLLHRDSLLTFGVLDRLLALRGVRASGAEQRDGPPAFDEQTYLGVEAAQLDICMQPLPDEAEAAYATTERLLGELADAVGPGLRVALIPDAYQVDDALWATLTDRHAGALERELPQRRLDAFLRARGVPCLDLLPALRAAQTEAPTYTRNDTHWSAHGNRAAARALADWLATRLP